MVGARPAPRPTWIQRALLAWRHWSGRCCRVNFGSIADFRRDSRSCTVNCKTFVVCVFVASEVAAMGVLVNEVPTGDSLPKRRGLRTCCCGCSLQAGCIVIGSFGLINGVSTLYLSLYALCHAGTRPGFDDNLLTNVLMLLYGALHLSTGLSLIYGADKRRPSLIKFWLFTRYVEFVMIIVASVYFLIMMISNGAPAGAVFASIGSLTIGIGILVYCIAIVHGFCRDITDFDNIQPLKEEI